MSCRATLEVGVKVRRRDGDLVVRVRRQLVDDHVVLLNRDVDIAVQRERRSRLAEDDGLPCLPDCVNDALHGVLETAVVPRIARLQVDAARRLIAQVGVVAVHEENALSVGMRG